jgi:hypothetical protein
MSYPVGIEEEATMTKLQDFLNSPIAGVSKMARAPKQGDLYGIELECEGRNVDWDGSDANLVKDWAPHADGSLRNNHGSSCEWVFNGPVKYKTSLERIEKLFQYFEKRKAKLVCSNRTSTHVHFNMGDKNAYQLVNMFILFTILEDLLDRYCGEDRRGNLFCLSSRHAEEQVSWISDAVFNKQNFGAFREDFRYCSLNLAAINKFGTVEFRAMRGLDTQESIVAWLNILNEFCEYACYTMKNPVDLIEAISVKTPLGFVKEVFSKENFMLLTKEIDEHEINASVYEGLRLVQMLCYRIGTEFDQVRLRGRDFWASFGGDPEPELDVDPELLAGGGQVAAGARRGARLAQPFGGNPFNRERGELGIAGAQAGMNMEQFLQQQIAAGRWGQNEARGQILNEPHLVRMIADDDAPRVRRVKAAKIRNRPAEPDFAPGPFDEDEAEF